MKKVFTTTSERQTEAVARDFVKSLTGGAVVALVGNLGAGKTAFVRGMARALGMRHPIQSPTFVIMKVYEVPRPKHVLRLVHVDCYRLGGAVDLYAIGIDEYLSEQGTMTVIEWADKVEELLPKGHWTIRFDVRGRTTRRITIER